MTLVTTETKFVMCMNGAGSLGASLLFGMAALLPLLEEISTLM